MSGANKILTVSYGTFSCTIEGFEDPFGTMKQIAEYFRDLAAEDRYFGAEPPVPDAEALRHIAEREAARRVEARLGTSGVHLRQLDGASAADAAVPVGPVAVPVPPQAAAPAAAPPAAAPATTATAPVASDVLTPSEVIDPTPESVAQRLSRIRAVVARARTAPLWAVGDDAEVADADPVAGDTAPLDQTRPPAAPAASRTAAPSALAPRDAAPHDATPHDAATAMPADAPTLATVDMAVEPGLDRVAEPVPDVSASAEADHAPTDAPAADLMFADTDPEDTALFADNDTPELAHDATAPDAAEEAHASAADAAAVEPADPVTAAEGSPGHPLAAPQIEDDPADNAPAQSADRPDLLSAAIGPLTGSTYSEVGAPLARIALLRRDDHAAAEATGQLDDLLAGRIDTSDIYDDDIAPEPLPAMAPASAATSRADDGTTEIDILRLAIRAADAAIPADTRAASSADPWPDTLSHAFGTDDDLPDPDAGLGAADPAGTMPDDHPEVTYDPAAATAPAALRLDPESRVSAPATPLDVLSLTAPLPIDPDDDDGTPLLLDEIDDVTGAPGPYADTTAPGMTADDGSAGRTGHERAVEDLERHPEDASVDRLLAATNSQLESTEVNRRRSAIAHLKAAVAAARADRVEPPEPEVEPEAAGGSVLNKFREDLARVVRPRRPVDQGEQRLSRRMPPLMLVSEQRIDLDDTPVPLHDAAAGPVRPRRISTREVSGDDDVTPAARGFADFAEAMGARDLPDMLEAAAAYAAFVEGRPSISRPQLMQMMRLSEGTSDEFSREEQLRSFGMLLRQGRIQKLKRGQFTVADDTRFRPSQRHAGE